MADGAVYHGFYALSLAMHHHPAEHLPGDGICGKDSSGVFPAHSCRYPALPAAEAAVSNVSIEIGGFEERGENEENIGIFKENIGGFVEIVGVSVEESKNSADKPWWIRRIIEKLFESTMVDSKSKR